MSKPYPKIKRGNGHAKGFKRMVKEYVFREKGMVIYVPESIYPILVNTWAN